MTRSFGAARNTKHGRLIKTNNWSISKSNDCAKEEYHNTVRMENEIQYTWNMLNPFWLKHRSLTGEIINIPINRNKKDERGMEAWNGGWMIV